MKKTLTGYMYKYDDFSKNNNCSHHIPSIWGNIKKQNEDYIKVRITIEELKPKAGGKR